MLRRRLVFSLLCLGLVSGLAASCHGSEGVPRSARPATGPDLTDGQQFFLPPADRAEIAKRRLLLLDSMSGGTPLSTDNWQGFHVGPIPTRWTVYIGPIPNHWNARVIEVAPTRAVEK